MSLVKSPRRTETKLAASRRNGKVSKGATTPEGLKRIRMASIRHGFYSQSEETAFLVLGEDPGEFGKMREEFLRGWDPAEGLQRRLVERLARAVWRAERADRMQEGQAVRLAKQVNKTREDRLHAQMMRLKLSSASLQKLAESVSQWHYVTTPKDLELMESLQREGVVKEISELALAFFSELKEPGADEKQKAEDKEAERQEVLRQVRAIFGISDEPYVPFQNEPPGSPAPESQQTDGAPRGAEANIAATAGAGITVDAGVAPESSPALDAGAAEPAQAGMTSDTNTRDNAESLEDRDEATDDAEVDDRYPLITKAQWEAREPVRQLLENLLRRKARACEAERQVLLKESLAGPSRYERAAEIAPTQPQTLLAQKLEEFGFRQIWRTANLLVKVKGMQRSKRRSKNKVKSLVA